MFKPGAIETLLEGVLLPSRWVGAGEVAEISLLTFDERELAIDARLTERHRLAELARRQVRIRAVLLGNRVTRIERLELLDGFPQAVAHPLPSKDLADQAHPVARRHTDRARKERGGER